MTTNPSAERAKVRRGVGFKLIRKQHGTNSAGETRRGEFHFVGVRIERPDAADLPDVSGVQPVVGTSHFSRTRSSTLCVCIAAWSMMSSLKAHEAYPPPPHLRNPPATLIANWQNSATRYLAKSCEQFQSGIF